MTSVTQVLPVDRSGLDSQSLVREWTMGTAGWEAVGTVEDGPSNGVWGNEADSSGGRTLGAARRRGEQPRHHKMVWRANQRYTDRVFRARHVRTEH